MSCLLAYTYYTFDEDPGMGAMIQLLFLAGTCGQYEVTWASI